MAETAKAAPTAFVKAQESCGTQTEASIQVRSELVWVPGKGQTPAFSIHAL